MAEAFRKQTWADYWRAVRHDAWLSFQEWLGKPARLLAWSQDFPAAEMRAIGAVGGGINESGVSPWHRFGQWPVLTFPRGKEGELRGWTRDAPGDYRGCQTTYQPLRDLASTTKRLVSIDIRHVDGLACSKGSLCQYDCLADFVRYECEDELGAADEDALYGALAHREIRIIHED